MTLNEARRRVGLPPVVGGDHVTIDGKPVPLSHIAARRLAALLVYGSALAGAWLAVVAALTSARVLATWILSVL